MYTYIGGISPNNCFLIGEFHPVKILSGGTRRDRRERGGEEKREEGKKRERRGEKREEKEASHTIRSYQDIRFIYDLATIKLDLYAMGGLKEGVEGTRGVDGAWREGVFERMDHVAPA